MRRPLLLAALALALGAATPAAADASAWRACAQAPGFSCRVLTVPLDRSGRLPGTVALHVARQRRAPAGGHVLVALSGGPGQSTISAAPFVAQSLRQALGRYRLVVLDQRGTGDSGVLRCDELQKLALLESADPVRTARCGERLGPRRDAYATTDSVDDIEALRQALHVDRIALQGTSYGTYVAQSYARRYPTHVERLILDSVVGPDGVDPLLLDSYGALPRILTEQCSHAACAGITDDPVGDVRTLAARLEGHALHGRVFDARGRAHAARIGAVGLTGVLFAGDLNPHLQAEVPAAIRSALTGDGAALLRLLKPSAGAPIGVRDLSAGLNVATTCDDVRLDYPISSPIADRPPLIARAVAAAPADRLGPFSRSLVELTSVDEQCRLWPPAHPSPPVTGPLPDVPALILSGRADVRTPLENAEEVASELRHATLIPVPGTGHDELDSDVSGCVGRALARWIAGRPVGAACASTSNGVPPQPVAPTRLADAIAPRGVRGARGRVLAAALGALNDVRESYNMAADAGLAGEDGGGLRGGWWRLSGDDGFLLRDVVWVPGVHVSGRVSSHVGRYDGVLRVAAPGGLGGRLHFRRGHGMTGVLGGRPVHLAEVQVLGAVQRSLRRRYG